MLAHDSNPLRAIFWNVIGFTIPEFRVLIKQSQHEIHSLLLRKNNIKSKSPWQVNRALHTACAITSPAKMQDAFFFPLGSLQLHIPLYNCIHVQTLTSQRQAEWEQSSQLVLVQTLLMAGRLFTEKGATSIPSEIIKKNCIKMHP